MCLRKLYKDSEAIPMTVLVDHLLSGPLYFGENGSITVTRK